MPQARPSKASKAKPAKKLTTKSTTRTGEDEATGPIVPVDLQQKCLSVFGDALKPDGQSQATVQEVKGHLYNRDFAAAFGKQEYLQVYASRWSPSRTLGYLQVLRDIQDNVLTGSHIESANEQPFRVMCLGGGAGAEHVALAGWISHMRETFSDIKCDAQLLDIASWGSVVDKLQESITTAPELSKYASAALKEANTALLSDDALNVSFLQQDALNWPPTAIAAAVHNVNLVTLMFTLNELYTTSLSKTQALLKTLTHSMQAGSSLLVVDSPGSYSTVSINGAEKKYPMQWLLDLTLLGPPGGRGEGSKAEEPTWEKVLEDGSQWFRLEKGLKYPIDLENMRYQIHLYRKL